MYTNYHAHTERCHHAVGTEESYILRAIDAGFTEFGFSDHTPYFLGDFYSDYRMEPDKLHDYVTTINSLRTKYADKIKIYLGLEMEYYPQHFEETLRFVLKEDIDYLILGQHFTGNEYDGVYMQGAYACLDKYLKLYVNQVVEAVKTGLFTYIAHPDIIDFETSEPIYKEEMSKICIAAKEANLPLEINLNGLAWNRSYPTPAFFELAADFGNDVIIGFDSHSLDAVFSPKIKMCYDKAVAMTKKLGLHLLDKANLIKPKI